MILLLVVPSRPNFLPAPDAPLRRRSPSTVPSAAPNPLESAVTSTSHLTLLESILTETVSSKSIRINTYKKWGRGVHPTIGSSVSASTSSLPLLAIPLFSMSYTRSATVPSILWKNSAPPTSSTTTAPADASSIAPGGCPWPVNAHRNPSTTPAIGFSPYSQRHFAGTRLLGYATGDANIQNCTRKGVTYFTSRYSAFNAESHKPTPNAVASASSNNSGSHNAFTPGRNPYPSTIASNTTNAIPKSTSPDITLERGKISRGKYTFVITRWF